MQIDLYQVDAFTDKVFGGNPAAVCPLEAWLPDDILQRIAMENNLSETAFFVPENNGYHLRWFTPTTEVDLCGHATLATAFTLFSHLKFKEKTIQFSSRSGILEVTKTESGFMMDFPIWEYEEIEIDPRITDALGHKPTALFKGYDWIALFDNEETVRTLNPNHTKLLEIENMRGILPTAKGKDYDFISRFFGPAVGVPEDPVTGSAHCILTPFWAKRLNKTSLHAYQSSARGGELFCQIKGDRVKIIGNAVLYMHGKINL